MRTDSLDVSSLVSYINDIKPFHSKLTTVVVEYQANDNVFATITDKSSMEMKFSSAWELQLVSDGVRTQYRIPAAVFPRHSDDFHQCKRIGVTDEVPALPGVQKTPGAYYVPYNNGVDVYVNGVKRTEKFDYTLNAARTVVQFIQNLPKQNDEICLNWTVVDRVFIGVGENVESLSGFDSVNWFDGCLDGMDDDAFDVNLTKTSINWLPYNLVYSVTDGCMEMLPYETFNFDSTKSSELNPIVNRLSATVDFDPIGRVRVVPDSTGKLYYVFEFNTAPPIDTKLWIRVEQREAYNGWTQTSIVDTVKFADHVKFKDTVNTRIVDPGTWSTDQALFGIDITPVRQGNFDVEDFDIMGYDSIQNPAQIGYYTFLNIRDVLNDCFTATYGEKYADRLGMIRGDTVDAHAKDASVIRLLDRQSDSVAARVSDTDPGAFDEAPFDTVVFDANNQVNFRITKTAPKSGEKSSASFTESLSISITTPNGTSTVNAVYAPDANGVVVVNPAADSVEIIHNFGYLPNVAIYQDGMMMYPRSITYPSNNSIIVTFSQPRSVIIRLT